MEGRLVPDASSGGPRIWTRQDGTPAASFEVSANTVRFLSARGEDEGSLSAGQEQSQAEDDIPF